MGCDNCRSSARCLECIERDGLTKAPDDVGTIYETDEEFLASLEDE